MPRHLNRSRRSTRLAGPVLAVAAVLAMSAWLVPASVPELQSAAAPGMTAQRTTAPAGTAGPAATRTAAAAATPAAGGPTARTQGPPSSMPTATVPPASTPPAPAPTNPATGRVDTLGGLVPDYVLPPVVDGLAPV